MIFLHAPAIILTHLRSVHVPDGEVELAERPVVLGPSEELVLPVADLDLHHPLPLVGVHVGVLDEGPCPQLLRLQRLTELFRRRLFRVSCVVCVATPRQEGRGISYLGRNKAYIGINKAFTYNTCAIYGWNAPKTNSRTSKYTGRNKALTYDTCATVGTSNVSHVLYVGTRQKNLADKLGWLWRLLFVIITHLDGTLDCSPERSGEVLAVLVRRRLQALQRKRLDLKEKCTGKQAK